MSLIYIGAIVNTHGFKGSLVLKNTPKGLEFVPNSIKVKIGFTEKFAKDYFLEKWKKESSGAIIKIKGIDNEIQAKSIKEMGVFVEIEDLKSKENSKLFFDVMDFDVYNISNNKRLGTIIEIWNLPANDVWLCETANGELPIPVIDTVIVKTDYSKKSVHINCIPGLLDLLETTPNDEVLTDEELEMLENDEFDPEMEYDDTHEVKISHDKLRMLENDAFDFDEFDEDDEEYENDYDDLDDDTIENNKSDDKNHNNVIKFANKNKL